VKSVSPVAPVAFPDSKWNCLEVLWEDGTISRVSPWESRQFMHASQFNAQTENEETGTNSEIAKSCEDAISPFVDSLPGVS